MRLLESPGRGCTFGGGRCAPSCTWHGRPWAEGAHLGGCRRTAAPAQTTLRSARCPAAPSCPSSTDPPRLKAPQPRRRQPRRGLGPDRLRGKAARPIWTVMSRDVCLAHGEAPHLPRSLQRYWSHAGDAEDNVPQLVPCN